MKGGRSLFVTFGWDGSGSPGVGLMNRSTTVFDFVNVNRATRKYVTPCRALMLLALIP